MLHRVVHTVPCDVFKGMVLKHMGVYLSDFNSGSWTIQSRFIESWNSRILRCINLFWVTFSNQVGIWPFGEMGCILALQLQFKFRQSVKNNLNLGYVFQRNSLKMISSLIYSGDTSVEWSLLGSWAFEMPRLHLLNKNAWPKIATDLDLCKMLTFV